MVRYVRVSSSSSLRFVLHVLTRHIPFFVYVIIHFFYLIGRKGIGLGKRASSPAEVERLAKVAKAAEEADQESFRDRTRREFEQRRAETRLVPAQQTCATLDERAGKEVNVELFNPASPLPANSFFLICEL
jgi:hypothetical protein